MLLFENWLQNHSQFLLYFLIRLMPLVLILAKNNLRYMLDKFYKDNACGATVKFLTTFK